LLAEAGVDDPETMHYGEEKSRGDFGDRDVGAVLGCIDPGDGYVLDLLAERGLSATPETTDGGDRAHGRGFVGDDAGAADALLASVREQHVAQAAGRYARNADDPNDRAVVFVRTDATPTGFVDAEVPGVEWVATDRQREIVAALRDQPTATAAEVADAVDASREHVRQTLARLAEAGTVEVRENAGDHGAHLYRALSGVGDGDQVALDPGETSNDPVWNSYTWSLAIRAPDPAPRRREPSTPGLGTREPAATADARGTDPPE
jgi:DNA-binding transcriptional ArsR family regulator